MNSIHFYFSHDKTNGCHIAIIPPPHLTIKNWKKKGMKIQDYTWHPFPSKQMNRTDDSPSLSCLPPTTRSRKKERLYSSDIPYLNSSPSLSTKYEPFSSFFNFEVAARIDLGYLPKCCNGCLVRNTSNGKSDDFFFSHGSTSEQDSEIVQPVERTG